MIINEAILDSIVAQKNRGRTWKQIGEPLGLSAAKVAELYEQALNDQPTLSKQVQLKTNLNRLESYLDALHTSIINLQDPKAIDTALKIVKEISELSDLKKQHASTVINVIDNRQVEEITVFVTNTTDNLRRNLIREHPELQATIEENWDLWLAEAIEPNQKRLIEAKEVIDL